MAGYAALHEYAKVFRICYPDEAYPTLPADIWEKLRQVSGFSKEYIEKFIGLKQPGPYAVSVTCFFLFPEKYKAVLPEVYAGYEKVFNTTFVK